MPATGRTYLEGAPTGTNANGYSSCTRWDYCELHFGLGRTSALCEPYYGTGNELVAAASPHVQPMHKALTQRNLQIHPVISDITGLTGRAMVDAILAGQGDGAELAQLRDPRIQADTETIRKSLEGNWRPEHLFTLGQSRDLYRIDQQQIVNC